ncbi:MAG: glucosamine-6-phosphate deaminase [Ichthyobacteriaceae bacterium]|nr:glucosamine-6-phosphate deaminase [Ichthyobacteriaceae bacterium]
MISSTKKVDVSYKPVGLFDERRLEKMQVVVAPNAVSGSIAVAQEIAQLIKDKAAKGEMAILGLATGSSPIKVYAELVRMHKEEGLSFQNVISFNLDEYTGLESNNPESYWYFMHEHLFNHVDVKDGNVNVPSGLMADSELNQFCIDYELKIEAAGGLDFQLLGIGRTGHIGFNEPGSQKKSATRKITLDHITRVDAAPSFHGLDYVPRTAVTMGVGTIMKAKRIILLSWGDNKAEVTKEMVEGPITKDLPASYLQEHENVTVVVDEGASKDITRFETPWLVEPITWNEELTRKAVVWLSAAVKKPILKLGTKDYNDNGMSSLLAQEGTAYSLNIRMFNILSDTITGWPGGKPGVDDSRRPERAEPARKRIIVFSPHPDDDVISMGGTLLRLTAQGHDVHIAYQTSGNIAVADHDAIRFCEFAQQFNDHLGKERTGQYDRILEEIKNKPANGIDAADVRAIKGLIRKGEANSAARYSGVKEENIHHLELPFYDTGKVKKAPLSQADVDIVRDLIEEIKPHQIFAAGDLADPHGTHKVCLDAVFGGLEELKEEEYMKNCNVWLYRGAWHEWPISEIGMCVPLHPEELDRKRQAIFFHQSQKDGVMFQGNDDREFWQRAEARNRGTAECYDNLGLPEYEAMEAFRQWDFYKKELV